MDNEPKAHHDQPRPIFPPRNFPTYLSLDLGPCCASCGAKDNLTPCNGCRVVYYCNTEHKAENFVYHAAACCNLQHAREVYERATEKLVAEFGSVPQGQLEVILKGTKGANRENKLEAMVDSWRARQNYAHAVAGFRSGPALKLAYEEGLSLFRDGFGPIDSHLERNLGWFRRGLGLTWGDFDQLGALAIRVGEEQVCYDMIKADELHSGTSDRVLKRWKTCRTYHIFSMIQGSDIFRKSLALSSPARHNMVLLTLVYLRIRSNLLSMHRVQQTGVLRGRLPPEIIEMVMREVGGPALRNNKKVLSAIRNGRGLAPLIQAVDRKLVMYFDMVDEKAPKYWRTFVNPHFWTEAVTGMCHGRHPGDEDIFKPKNHVYEAFLEIEGAVEWVRTTYTAKHPDRQVRSGENIDRSCMRGVRWWW
jgi:hypothetical protein